MEKKKEKIVWKKLYSAILIANAIYILIFYFITDHFSH